MKQLNNEELLECLLKGNVAFEGLVRRGDGSHYEFHLVMKGESAHRLSAHMAAKARATAEAKKPKMKKWGDSVQHTSIYSREAHDPDSVQASKAA
jgi:hypothetical protein